MQNVSRVLLISGLRIFPSQTGGHLRSGNFAKALARLGHEVRIYSLAGRADDYRCGASSLHNVLEPRLVEDINLSLQIGLIQTLARRLGLPRLWQYPIMRAALFPESLRRSLDWADLIVCDLPFIPPVRGAWQQKPWLLLSHNLEHKLQEQGSWLDQFIFAPLTLRIERAAPRLYDGILACADEDQAFFQAHAPLGKAIALLANGIDAAAYAPDPKLRLAMRKELDLKPEERLIVFSGSRYAPNVEALAQLQSFIEKNQVFLREQGFKFLILGSMAAPSRDSITIATGFVPTVLPYFQAADFAINPVERGSGSNVKMFEYLAARLPVLSTEFGVRGMQLRPELDYIPFVWSDLPQRLKRLAVEGRAESWPLYAEELWQRQMSRCDMTEIVRQQWSAMLRSLHRNPESPFSNAPQSILPQ